MKKLKFRIRKGIFSELDVSEFRGFTHADDFAPLIFIIIIGYFSRIFDAGYLTQNELWTEFHDELKC